MGLWFAGQLCKPIRSKETFLKKVYKITEHKIQYMFSNKNYFSWSLNS